MAIPHYSEANDTVFCHSCLRIFREKLNFTTHKADSAFVSIITVSLVLAIEISILQVSLLYAYVGFERLF